MAKKVRIDESALQTAIEAGSRELLEDIGRKVTAAAKHNAPVDTGNLRDSIGYDITGDTVRIGASAPYARYVEEGTSRQKAQPFLRPALYKGQ